MRENYDVIVVGGGPAGACISSRLAQAGIRVALLEGKQFPRPHIGESLLAMSMPLLEDWGVLAELSDAGFVHKKGSLFLWGNSGRPIQLDMPRPGYAFQVDRSRFDEMLLRRAVADGADVFEQHRARQLSRGADGSVEGAVVSDSSRTYTLKARFVVDASGLTQFVPRRLRLPVELSGPTRIALSAYYRGARRLPSPDEGHIITEACADGWLWFIPLSETITSVGFVGDAQDLVDRPDAMFARQVKSSSVVSNLIVGSSSVSGSVRVLNYTNHIVAGPLWGDGYAIVGDSGFFVDPLFSTGVHGALYSATLAAAALVSVLEGTVTETEARRWYEHKVRSHYARVQRMVQLLYGIHPGESRFWRSRDLLALTDVEGETWLRELGALGLRFFADPVADGALELPPALGRRLHEFHVDPRPRALRLDTRVALANGVTVNRGWMRHLGRLAPAVVLSHRAARTIQLEYPSASWQAQLVLELTEKPCVGAAFEAIGGSRVSAEKVCTFLGTLVEAGVLNEAGVVRDRRVASTEAVGAAA